MASTYLTAEEELSLNIMALIQYERVPFSCIKCSMSDDNICEQYNCTGPSDPTPLNEDSEESVAYVSEIQTEFPSCPIHFIVNDHYNFLDKYSYIQEFPHTMPSWEEVDPRFWESYKIYKGLTNKYANEPKKTPMSDYEEGEEEIVQHDHSAVYKHFNK